MNEPDKLEAGREKILSAAATAIAQNGYHGMSMRELARKTGRSLGGFYNYFASKDQVLLALHVRAFDTLMGRAGELIARAHDPDEQLYFFVANHISYFAKNQDVMRVLVTEAASLQAADRKRVRRIKEKYFALAESIVERLLASRRSRPDVAELERATYSLFGMLNWIYGWYLPKRHGTPLDVAKTVHRMAVQGFTTESVNDDFYVELDRRLESGDLPPLLRRRDDGAAA